MVPRNLNRRVSKLEGFTLPELLITILLISILFTVAVLLTSGNRTSQKMRNYELAVSLAQQAIEAVRAAPFELLDDADAGAKSVETDFNTLNAGVDLFKPSFNTNSIRYNRLLEIDDIPPKVKDGTPVRLKLVRVVVSWKPPEGDKVTYEITTTVSDIN